jgi:hypothetical protein
LAGWTITDYFQLDMLDILAISGTYRVPVARRLAAAKPCCGARYGFRAIASHKPIDRPVPALAAILCASCCKVYSRSIHDDDDDDERIPIKIKSRNGWTGQQALAKSLSQLSPPDVVIGCVKLSGVAPVICISAYEGRMAVRMAGKSSNKTRPEACDGGLKTVTQATNAGVATVRSCPVARSLVQCRRYDLPVDRDSDEDDDDELTMTMTTNDDYEDATTMTVNR